MSQARIVLPLDARGATIPVPGWQFSRMVALDFAGSGSAVLAFAAEQYEVVLLRAVDCRARIRVGGEGAWAVLLAGQSIAQPVRAGQVAEIEVLDDAGRVEIIPFDRSGDEF
jgi:hypothetical protein